MQNLTKSKKLDGNILVLGGYGAVGRVTALDLARRLPGQVIVAGRDRARAAELAAGSGGTLLPAQVDLADPASLEQALEGVCLVVLSVEPRTPAVHPARRLFERGIGLVDVTATHSLITEVERHGTLARTGEATALLSVGVAPGLTNLLARRAAEAVGGAERLDISVVLGAGEAHGKDAVRWTVAQLMEGDTGGARPLKVATWPPGRAERTHHPFPFSDQHTLRRTLGVPDVTTRLGLDSGALTGLLFGLRRAGVFRAARRARLDGLLTASLTRIHLGGDRFAVRVDAHRGGRRVTRALTATSQSRFTGLTAAEVAARVYEGGLPAGVHHIEEVAALADVPEALAAHGLTAWAGDTGA
ncbi:saccharopine dehydrogenase family protein [Streptomyces sp. NPDC059009]|uniref:saccharopine dehydrogenase family protein n=1 Tax=Streptomyces sp. NPDC059009 TaxID=3346694 RepID=UPI003676E829